MKDILLNDDFDLQAQNGDFVVGDSLLQEIGIILRMSPGDLKSDPVLGPGLVKFNLAKHKPEEIQATIKRHMQRDLKEWNTVKDLITLHFKQL